MAHDVENICMNTIPIVPAVTNHTAPGDDDTYEEITPAEIIHANVRDRHNENMNEKNIGSFTHHSMHHTRRNLFPIFAESMLRFLQKLEFQFLVFLQKFFCLSLVGYAVYRSWN